MEESLKFLQSMVGHALILVSALVEFLWTSSISMLVPTFAGVAAVTFLLGLLLGRITKGGGAESSEQSEGSGDDRIVLDLERLKPLGLSAEEEAETEVMDISGLKPNEMTDRTARSDQANQLGPGTSP